MNETGVLLESLEKMYEDMDDPSRVEYIKKQYDSVAKGQSIGKFENGMSEYKQNIQLVKTSIEKGNAIDTAKKKGFVCAAIQGLEQQILHSFKILRIANPDAICEEFTEKLKHIDSLRKKYCDQESPMVDEVVEKLT